jgi:hypothetical protein
MNNAATITVQQQQVLAEFNLKQQARAKRRMQMQRARYGRSWPWIFMAVIVWLQVALGWLVDLSGIMGQVVIFGPVIAMCVLGVAMVRSLSRAREELFLDIIQQESPESYRQLQQERLVR